MPLNPRQQLRKVYDQLHLSGHGQAAEVAFGEGMFNELLTFLALVPEDGDLLEIIFRASDGVPAIKIAEVFNVLLWSAEDQAGIDLTDLQEWFYSEQPRRVEVALRCDIYPSNSMQESQRILEKIERKWRHLRYLCAALRREVDYRLAEEEQWAKYRRDTFEMPKEMTPSIMGIIKDIKRK